MHCFTENITATNDSLRDPKCPPFVDNTKENLKKRVILSTTCKAVKVSKCGTWLVEVAVLPAIVFKFIIFIANYLLPYNLSTEELNYKLKY